MNLVIDTEVNLIPISLDFASEIHEGFTEEVITFLPVAQVTKDVRDTERFIRNSITQRKKGTDLVWVILYQKEFAGCCGLHTIQSKEPHFGIWITASMQGKGIGKRVVKNVIEWGLENLNVLCVKYPVDVRNKASLALIAPLDPVLHSYTETTEPKELKTNEYRVYKT